MENLISTLNDQSELSISALMDLQKVNAKVYEDAIKKKEEAKGLREELWTVREALLKEMELTQCLREELKQERTAMAKEKEITNDLRDELRKVREAL